ncbi:methyltransferase domain-containing protein [Streptomyces sp. NPDC054933]
MKFEHKQVEAALRGLLLSVAEDLGRDVDDVWVKAAQGAPRHKFLPDTIWVYDDNGELRPCNADEDAEAWFRAAYADAPVITQVCDGSEPTDGDVWPSSSASAPSIVFRMLRELDVQPDDRVLEIGTGTGWHAALLTHRLGDNNVTTVEVDASLAAQARTRIGNAGYYPQVICADGAQGWTPRGPYDRIISTCSVNRVPSAWCPQISPGGIILTPWESPWLCYGLLRLEVGTDASASGRFSPHSAFMLMRGQRTGLRIFRDVVKDDHQPKESSTNLSPWVVTGDDWDLQFAIGLRLHDVWNTWHDDPDVEEVEKRLWLATTDATSWAAIDYDGKHEDRFTVWQHGPRKLWDEVESVHEWWTDSGRPDVARFGYTVTAEEQFPWLDKPSNRLGPGS